MRCNLLFCSLAAMVSNACAQWTVTSAPNNGIRKDDIFFIGRDTGWVAEGGDGSIRRTYDGGDTWQPVYAGPDYLRSIEFATPQIGFCGTLSNVFLRTTDGGDSWQDIANLIPSPSSICGLCAASPQVIYGCGVWFEPAYVIRSTDGGTSWDKTDLSSMASALIDVFFLNPDTGFASGMAEPPSLGGVILATTDGGDTWTVRHLTGTAEDYIWKLQSPDSIHLYGSVEAMWGTGTRIVRSGNAGTTWLTDPLNTVVSYMQVIGFLDTLHGWVGGDMALRETLDGGITWQTVSLDQGYDRFHRVSATEAFMCGNGVYKYGGGPLGTAPDPPSSRLEWIDLLPNPASDHVRATAHVHQRSQAQITLCTSDGRVLRTLLKGELVAGESSFTLRLDDLATGSYYVNLRTNQGQSTVPFVKR